MQSGVREELAAKLAESILKEKATQGLRAKVVTDDQTEHNTECSEHFWAPGCPHLGWSYTSDAGHEQGTALGRTIMEDFLEEVTFGLDSGETWDRAFWLRSWWDSQPGFSKTQQEEAASGKLPKVRVKGWMKMSVHNWCRVLGPLLS